MKNNQVKPSIISGKAYWASLTTPNRLSNMWQIDVGNLDAKNKKILRDDKIEKVDLKKSDNPGEVDSENIEQKSKTNSVDNASAPNVKEKDSISDENEKQQKASKIEENNDKDDKQETELKPDKKESENKIEATDDSSEKEGDKNKDVEKGNS